MLLPSRLSKKMVSNIEQKMSQVAKTEIKAVEFQKAYARASASAFVQTMKGPAIGIGSAPAFFAVGTAKGLDVKSSIIRDQAFNFFKSKAPRATSITKKYFEAVAKAIVEECENVTITSSNGFGGAVGRVVFPGNAMGSLIFSSLPAKFKRGQYMQTFCQSIGMGVQFAMLKAKSKPVPNAPAGSPPPMAPMVAKFS